MKLLYSLILLLSLSQGIVVADGVLPHMHTWAHEGRRSLVRNAEFPGCYYDYGQYIQFPEVIGHCLWAGAVAAIPAGVSAGICYYLKLPNHKIKLISAGVAVSTASLALYLNPYIWLADCKLH